MWLAIGIAHLFKWNKALAVLASNISIPPFIPLIVFGSFYTGKIWLGNHATVVDFSQNPTLEMVGNNLLQYVIGSFTLATLVAIFAWVFTYFFVQQIKGIKKRKLQ